MHVCPVYCRFCFRREKVGPGGEALSAAELEAALAYIRAHPEIWEVILTGGDPLMLAPRRLAELIAALDAIAHVAVIRIHSRVPVVDPGRVTDELVAALQAAARARSGSPSTAIMPASSRPSPRAALARLADAGIPLMGQTVLLRGVNDDVETLEALMRALVTCARKTLLPAPSRSGARHRPFPRLDRARPGADEGLARPSLGPRPADLCARRARRPRQGADRARLSRRRSRRRSLIEDAFGGHASLSRLSRADLRVFALPTGPGASTTSSMSIVAGVFEGQRDGQLVPLAQAAPSGPSAADDSRAASTSAWSPGAGRGRPRVGRMRRPSPTTLMAWISIRSASRTAGRDQPVRGRSLVGDREEATALRRGRQGRARPGADDFDRAQHETAGRSRALRAFGGIT